MGGSEVSKSEVTRRKLDTRFHASPSWLAVCSTVLRTSAAATAPPGNAPRGTLSGPPQDP